MTEHRSVEDLYRRLAPYAISKVQRMVGRWEVAEEIVQDVFCKLLLAQIIFPEDRMAYAWIYRTSHNAALDFIRSGRYRNHLTLDSASSIHITSPDPEHIAMRRDHLHKTIAKLDESDAAIFAFYYMDDMTHQEIADLLEISRKTVERSVQRGLAVARLQHQGDH